MESIEVAMAIVQNPEGRFLSLTKASAYTDNPRYEKNRLETAGGKIEEGEEPVEAAVRELKEETGIEAQPVLEVVPTSLGFEHLQNDRRITFYPVPLKVDKTEIELSEEHSDHHWFTAEEFEEKLPKHNVEGFKKVTKYF